MPRAPQHKCLQETGLFRPNMRVGAVDCLYMATAQIRAATLMAMA